MRKIAQRFRIALHAFRLGWLGARHAQDKAGACPVLLRSKLELEWRLVANRGRRP